MADLAFAQPKPDKLRALGIMALNGMFDEMDGVSVLRQAVTEENSLFLMACDIKGVIGFAQTGFLRNGVAELFRLYVQPSGQRTGAGTLLLAETEAWLAQQDVPGYGAFVHSRNEIGKAFYTKSGFVRRPERDHDGEWYLWKEL